MRISMSVGCFAVLSVSLLAGCDMLRKDRATTSPQAEQASKEPPQSSTKSEAEPKPATRTPLILPDPIVPPIVPTPKDGSTSPSGTPLPKISDHGPTTQPPER